MLIVFYLAPQMVFYLVKLESGGIYTMTELLRVRIPMSVSEAYLTNLSRNKNVIHIFESHCKEKDDATSSWRLETLPATDITFLLDKQRKRKRKNTAGHWIKSLCLFASCKKRELW